MFQVANDFSNLTAIDKKQWEVNITRGIAYRHGLKWQNDNAKNMKGLLRDFKVKTEPFFFFRNL